jgi:hypothetical protein
MMNPYGWFKEAYNNSLNHAHERIRELEARLRELADAAEWRDECQHFFDDVSDNLSSEIYWMVLAHLTAARAAYQAALKAAKEG